MKKTFSFVYAQTHSKCPDMVGWWLLLKPNDDHTLNALKNEFGKTWCSIYESKLNEGNTLLVNRNGGYCYEDNGIVLGTLETNSLVWPNGNG